MDERVRILMAEANCDEGQATLALSAGEYDIRRAMRALEDLKRHTAVAKARLRSRPQHLHGLVCLAADIREGSLLRVRSVISYNPAVGQTDMAASWYLFEQYIYTCRLFEGSVRGMTFSAEQAIEKAFGPDSPQRPCLLAALRRRDGADFADLLEEILLEPLSARCVEVEAHLESIAYSVWRRPSDPPPPAPLVAEPICLTVDFPDAEIPVRPGRLRRAAADLSPGDRVFCRIHDPRDIARYLAQLLGGEGEDPWVAAPVDRVERRDGRLWITLRFAPAVLGLGWASPSQRLISIPPAEGSWPRRIGSRLLDLLRRLR